MCSFFSSDSLFFFGGGVIEACVDNHTVTSMNYQADPLAAILFEAYRPSFDRKNHSKSRSRLGVIVRVQVYL